MSIEDLEQHGVLLPKKEWGKHELKTTTSEIPMLLIFLCSVAGCIITWMGNGNSWTWVGICLFFVAFAFVIVLCDKAIQRQRERFKQERGEAESKSQPETEN